MRIFHCRPGTKFAGDHKIFENKEECLKEIPNAKIWRWAIDDMLPAEIGDWVQAEDGYVVQILDRYMMTNKKTQLTTFAYRFPMCTQGVSERKDGTYRYPQFYAQFTTGSKGSFSQRPRSFRSNEYSKIRFAALIIAGVPPTLALKQSSNDFRFKTQHQIESKIRRLLMDPLVQNEMKKNVEAFKDKLKGNITMDQIVERITSHWKHVKSGSAQELKAIHFMLEVHDIEVVDEKTGKKKLLNRKSEEEIDEAEVIEEETSAPPLGKED